jgi:serine-type D-Ala-D-Ala carboxypeptidase/endopeptidase (penicillin-binding protein 4)
MRILKRLQAVCVLFAVAGTTSAQQLPITVADALQRAEIPDSAVGIYVREANANPILLASNEMAPFNPASTMKLVTSNAALEILGPSFTWKTQAYTEGKQTGDVLHGDLIIKGSGDPKLVIENFWLFLRRIRAKGIREIRGNLILDRSVFEDSVYDPAKFDGDPMKPYNVGPDALLLNYKALGFRFAPDEARAAVSVAIDPPLAASYPVTPPRLANGDCGDWRGKLSSAVDGGGARFNGVFSASCGEKTWYVHPYQMTHTQYFALTFRRIWADLGGTLKGAVRPGLVSPTARLVVEWESVALSEVIRDINKYSNNGMARQLLLTLANSVLKLPANTERGAAVVRTWLTNKGIDAPEMSIENGSGLSRTERISALTMGRLLAAAFQAPTMPEFMASLPLVGYDGTMRLRLTTQTVAGKAHIKTGMLSEVRTIAGYVLAASGKRYVVVFMINHANAIRGQDAQDALLQWVYERG